MDTMTQSPAAESSPAEIEISKFSGSEYANWRKTGMLPESDSADSKTADSSVEPSSENPRPGQNQARTHGLPGQAGHPEGTENSAPASEAGTKTQEQRQQKRGNARKRIQELVAKTRQLESELARVAQPGVPTAPRFRRDGVEAPSAVQPRRAGAPGIAVDGGPASREAQPGAAAPHGPTANGQQPTAARPKPALEERTPDGIRKYASYEDYVEDLADWRAEQHLVQHQRQQAEQVRLSTLQGRLNEGRGRYQDFDTVATPVLNTLIQDRQIPNAVKSLVGESPVLPDLLYVLGGSKADLKDFVDTARANPIAALRKVVLLEQLVMDELKSSRVPRLPRQAVGSGLNSARAGTSSTAAHVPEKKITDAPAPPREVAGKTTPPADDVEHAVREDDFERYRSAANRRDLSGRKK